MVDLLQNSTILAQDLLLDKQGCHNTCPSVPPRSTPQLPSERGIQDHTTLHFLYHLRSQAHPGQRLEKNIGFHTPSQKKDLMDHEPEEDGKCDPGSLGQIWTNLRTLGNLRRGYPLILPPECYPLALPPPSRLLPSYSNFCLFPSLLPFFLSFFIFFCFPLSFLMVSLGLRPLLKWTRPKPGSGVTLILVSILA